MFSPPASHSLVWQDPWSLYWKVWVFFPPVCKVVTRLFPFWVKLGAFPDVCKGSVCQISCYRTYFIWTKRSFVFHIQLGRHSQDLHAVFSPKIKPCCKAGFLHTFKIWPDPGIVSWSSPHQLIQEIGRRHGLGGRSCCCFSFFRGCQAAWIERKRF